MMVVIMMMMIIVIMMVMTDPRSTFPDQGWSCEFSLEKGGARIRPSGSRNASYEETQNAIWVSKASTQSKRISLKKTFSQRDGDGYGGQSYGVNYRSCKNPLSSSLANVDINNFSPRHPHCNVQG